MVNKCDSEFFKNNMIRNECLDLKKLIEDKKLKIREDAELVSIVCNA